MKYAYVAVGLSLMAACANAEPTRCTPNTSSAGFTCNIFESLANGDPSDVSGIFALPNLVTAGYVILLETAGSLPADNTQWSDVLHFIDNGQGSAITGQLLSAGCNNAAAPFSCFPTFATVNSVPNAFLIEAATGATVFSAGPNTYNIFMDAGAVTATAPEPASVLLGLSGFALLVLAKKTQL
jgi:hypothetical protein